MEVGKAYCQVSLNRLLRAMATMMDSIPVFKERMLTIGVDAISLGHLVAANVNTLSKLAFCANYNPNMPDDTNLVAFFKAKIMGPTVAAGGLVPDLDAGLLASLRQGFFEAHTMMLAELKSRIERGDDDKPRKVPTLERASRLEDQRRRIIGVDISGPIQPAFSLIDAVSQQKDDGILKYLSAEACPSRDDELQVGKKIVVADVSTDLKIRQALQRRSLAYDQLGIISYATLEAWMSWLFVQPSRIPPDDFCYISMQQVLQADKQAFVFMSERCRTGLAMTNLGVYPAEAALQLAKSDPMVMATLQPLPRRAAHHAPVPKAKATIAKPKAEPRAKAKGKGKGKAVRGPAMPKQLQGMHAKNEQGESLCYGYNLGTCIKCAPGAKCDKGLHICAKCLGIHSQMDCH